MNKTFALRLISSAGFSRIEVPISSTFIDLKYAITNQVNIHAKEQKLFYDTQSKKAINFPDNTSVTNLGLKEGDTIFLSNQNAEFNTGKNQVSSESKPKCNHSERETCINCIDKKKKTEPEKKTVLEKQKEKEGLTSKCTHAPGQKCLNCMGEPTYKGELKYSCQHAEGGKCPNCVGKEFIQDAKHKSFDQYLAEKKEKCKGIHAATSKCNNCMPPQDFVFKLKPGCPNHPPFPDGMCNKCLPPNANLHRQPYRHIDYVSFMNQEEVNLFVNEWLKHFCMKQRMGFLYGYYAEDPNYPNGVRAIVEAIYEPPQVGDTHAVEPLVDPDKSLVDQVAEALSLECIGWIFTTINTEKDVCLTSADIRKAAKYQELYSIAHESDYKVSKFITVCVKPQENNQAYLECYMVSDLCQMLERDGVFGDSDSKKEMKVRTPNKNEVLPTIYMENRPVSSFDPDFCIVNVGHGAPQDKHDFNILKSYDFPVASRSDKGIVTENMIKDYFKKHKKDKPLAKYGSFYFLIYLAKVFDIGTAKNFACQVVEECVDAEVLEQLLSSIFGYN